MKKEHTATLIDMHVYNRFGDESIAKYIFHMEPRYAPSIILKSKHRKSSTKYAFVLARYREDNSGVDSIHSLGFFMAKKVKRRLWSMISYPETTPYMYESDGLMVEYTHTNADISVNAFVERVTGYTVK